jgi:hypothetical protein
VSKLSSSATASVCEQGGAKLSTADSVQIIVFCDNLWRRKYRPPLAG